MFQKANRLYFNWTVYVGKYQQGTKSVKSKQHA